MKEYANHDAELKNISRKYCWTWREARRIWWLWNCTAGAPECKQMAL